MSQKVKKSDAKWVDNWAQIESKRDPFLSQKRANQRLVLSRFGTPNELINEFRYLYMRLVNRSIWQSDGGLIESQLEFRYLYMRLRWRSESLAHRSISQVWLSLRVSSVFCSGCWCKNPGGGGVGGWESSQRCWNSWCHAHGLLCFWKSLRWWCKGVSKVVLDGWKSLILAHKRSRNQSLIVEKSMNWSYSRGNRLNDVSIRDLHLDRLGWSNKSSTKVVCRYDDLRSLHTKGGGVGGAEGLNLKVEIRLDESHIEISELHDQGLYIEIWVQMEVITSLI